MNLRLCRLTKTNDAGLFNCEEQAGGYCSVQWFGVFCEEMMPRVAFIRFRSEYSFSSSDLKQRSSESRDMKGAPACHEMHPISALEDFKARRTGEETGYLGRHRD